MDLSNKLEFEFSPNYYCYCNNSQTTEIICRLDMIHESVSSTPQLIKLRIGLSSFLIKKLLQKYEYINLLESKIQMVEFYKKNDGQIDIDLPSEYYENKDEKTKEQWVYITNLTQQKLRDLGTDKFKIRISRQFDFSKYMNEFYKSQMNINVLLEDYLEKRDIENALHVLERGPVISNDTLRKITNLIKTETQKELLDKYIELYMVKIPIK